VVLMKSMYEDRKWNTLIILGSLILLVLFWTGIRQQVAISDEQVMNRTSNSVTITWTTSVPATSQVRFGPVLGGNCKMIKYTPVNNNFATSHSITLSSLGSSATFCYNVVSRGSNGYEATGSIFQFQTSP